jgi:hypothetical protein
MLFGQLDLSYIHEKAPIERFLWFFSRDVFKSVLLSIRTSLYGSVFPDAML